MKFASALYSGVDVMDTVSEMIQATMTVMKTNLQEFLRI